MWRETNTDQPLDFDERDIAGDNWIEMPSGSYPHHDSKLAERIFAHGLRVAPTEGGDYHFSFCARRSIVNEFIEAIDDGDTCYYPYERHQTKIFDIVQGVCKAEDAIVLFSEWGHRGLNEVRPALPTPRKGFTAEEVRARLAELSADLARKKDRSEL